ncbi:MAG: chromate resistance protein ChrB domain-containing protein [Methyloligellaceae bacterium]
MPSPTEITVSQLSRLIGTPDLSLIIDVRIDENFQLNPALIPCSVRISHKDIDTSLARIGENKKAIVVCHEGHKLSQGYSAQLRNQGIMAETLEGGFVAWSQSGNPVLSLKNMPKPNDKGQTVWVTRHRPKIDRIACPWLIRRFIDPSAVFLFVSPSEVLGVADKFDATPFDIDDVFWSHREEKCSFDTFIEEFSIETPPLKVLAAIVRGADTNRHDLAPEAAGLLAASLGLSRMYKDDLEQLESGMLLYDAFYRWARDAREEGHDWPAALNTGSK